MSIKISTNGVDRINSELIQKDLKRIKNNEKETGNFVSDDSVELSSRATDLKNLQAKAMSTPDVRQEKVADIKMQINNGTYQISSEKIAERMIEDALEG
jgi:negative regulator of flagellin synthesis FlgM